MKGAFFFVKTGNFFYHPPKQKKNIPKRGPLVSFFRIFTTEFSHFLMAKKYFLSPKSD